MLTASKYFVKEHVSALKLTDRYDILDAETQQPLGQAREEPPTWAKYLRFVINKQLMPTRVNVYDGSGQAVVLSIARGVTLFRSKVIVRDGGGNSIGYFKSKLFSLGGGFRVFNMSGQQLAEIKGDWKGWNFKLLGPGGNELGTVTKKWAGIGKELFTSADNYIIALSENATQDEIVKKLLLAAGLSIDLVYGERR